MNQLIIKVSPLLIARVRSSSFAAFSAGFYGRADAEELADKLANDLGSIGYRVWIDNKQIIKGDDWQIRIENAINESDVFLALLSPHAVRRPDRWCLDEIAMVRSLKKGSGPAVFTNGFTARKSGSVLINVSVEKERKSGVFGRKDSAIRTTGRNAADGTPDAAYNSNFKLERYLKR